MRHIGKAIRARVGDRVTQIMPIDRDEHTQGEIVELVARTPVDLLMLARTAWRLNPNQSFNERGRDRYERLNYLILDRVKGMEIPSSQLSKILSVHTRNSTVLSPEDLTYYETEIAIPNKVYGRHPQWGWLDEDTMICYKVFVDGLFGVILTYRGEPNAIVSFSVDDPSTLKITQMQGINPFLLTGLDPKSVHEEDVPRASPKGLYNIWFRQVLFEIGIYTAQQVGICTLGIQSGHNNPRTKVDPEDGKVHLPLEDALVVYDKFAEDMGLTQNQKTKDWYIQVW